MLDRLRLRLINNYLYRRFVRAEARVLLARLSPAVAIVELRDLRRVSQNPEVQLLAYNIEREIRDSVWEADRIDLEPMSFRALWAALRRKPQPRAPLVSDSGKINAAVMQSRFRQAQLAPDSPLTERQMECLEWAAAGKSSSDIAGILGLSKRTVDEHLAATCDKLGVKTRVQAVGKLEKIRGLAVTP